MDSVSYTIRSARAEDQDAIRLGVRHARLDPTNLDWRRFKVAEDGDGQMIGFCQVRHYRGVRELGSLYVRRRHRRQGIGSALVRACLAEETPPVYLETGAGELRQSYYERFGFQRISIWRAPLWMRGKALLGNLVLGLLWRVRIIVMRWDG